MAWCEFSKSESEKFIAALNAVPDGHKYDQDTLAVVADVRQREALECRHCIRRCLRPFWAVS